MFGGGTSTSVVSHSIAGGPIGISLPPTGVHNDVESGRKGGA